MNKNKLIPIILCLVFLIIGYFLFAKLKDNNIHFNELEITYNGETKKYDSLEFDQKLNVGSFEFVVASIDKKTVVLKSIELVDDKVEFAIKLNEESKICFSQDDCALAILK